MIKYNDQMKLIRGANQTLAKSRCEKSDALKDFEWVYSGIAYVNVASADKMDKSMKKLIELAKISERKEADRADKVCRSLAFHYPFHNRPHRTSSTPWCNPYFLK